MITKDRQYISIGQVAKLLGVSVPTLRRWEKNGKLISCFRTFGAHRRYDYYKVRAQFLIEKPNKAILYSRVSSHDQKKDLKTQTKKLIHYCKMNDIDTIECIEDIGSGLNFNKKGFKKLFNMIIKQQFNHLIINHKDRLLRFGSDLIFKLCDYFDIKVTIIEKANETFEKELVSSVLEIITVFSSKLYGSRSHKNRKANAMAA